MNLGTLVHLRLNAKIGAGNWISASGSTFNCQTCLFDAHCTATLFILHGVMFQKKSCWLRWIASSLSSCIGRFRWTPWALIVSVSAIIFTIPNTIFFIMLREDINWKKTFSFGHCPNYLNPPPMTPIRATWSSFFGSQNSRFESQFRT